MCPSSSESQAALPGGFSNKENKNDYDNSVRAGERRFLSEFLGWLQKIKVAEELLSLGELAFPLLISGLETHSKTITSIFFLAHMGNIELAGGSLSLGFANITGYSVMKGLATGMEPLCSQAYGARRWTLISQTFRQTLCLLFLAAISITLLWLNMEPIIQLFVQDKTITSVAKVFITFSIPELFAQALLHPLRLLLKAQNLTTPLLVAATFAMILHIPINYLLAIHWNWGVIGVALASVFNILNFNIALLVYLFFSKTTIKPWDGSAVAKCYRAWHPLLKLMVESFCSVCLEWWWYEIVVLLCGLINNPEANVAAMGILMQLTGLLYVFPSSLSSSLSTRVGQQLGAEEPQKARRTTILGISIAMVWGLLAFTFTIAVKNVWGNLYTCEPQVVALTSDVLPILGLSEIGNSPQTVACGVLLGSSRNNVNAWINFIAFYLIGLPISTYMAFWLKMGLLGLWYGLATAQASCVCMMIFILIFTNWNHQAVRAKKLTEAFEERKNDLEANLLS